MKRYGFLALAALALFAFAATGAYAADQCCPATQGCKWVIMYQPYNPGQTAGAGPGGATQTGTPVLVCPAPCCPADNERYCGAFCAAGQTPPGWQFGWCDEYWLRPDSNL